MQQVLRAFEVKLEERLGTPTCPLIQVVIGPRQVGKTTAVRSILKRWPRDKALYISADENFVQSTSWLREQWQRASRLGPGALFVVDEIQKIERWQDVVKDLWDSQAQASEENRLRVVLLGSSSLEIQSGLRESLTGRFETLHAYHWDLAESQVGYGLSLDAFLSYGGYPGSYPLLEDYTRWHAFLRESIVETVIGKDLLGMRSVKKPVVFRQLFELLCRYPAQEISYTKLLGQLQDKGNVEVVKNYLALYEGAFLFKVLEKYSTSSLRVKSSSPKILPLCPAFYAMTRGADAAYDSEDRGRLLEVAVGAVLVRLPGELFYWRQNDHEVDFVYRFGKSLFAIEVKSGRKKSRKGLETFRSLFASAQLVLVGETDLLDLSRDPEGTLQRLAFT